MKQLRKHAFRKWLGNKKPREIVGARRVCTCCPIALYLTERGHVRPTVDPYFWTDRKGAHNRMPPWAMAFVQIIDDQTGVSITARRALKILDTV